MNKRYFKKIDPKCKSREIKWIELTGKEFYRFVNSPESQGRHFIDMDDVVLEVTEAQAHEYKAEQNHHYYIQSQEEGWSTLSIYAVEDKNGCGGEEVVRDESLDVEAEAILRIEKAVLQNALNHLDSESYQLIHALYLADTRKTLRQGMLSLLRPLTTLRWSLLPAMVSQLTGWPSRPGMCASRACPHLRRSSRPRRSYRASRSLCGSVAGPLP